jgi:uncharacterized protein YprB with RNaseH-like and TPR domain
VCLVVDRTFPASLRHGDAQVGEYAQSLAQHGAGLSRLDQRHDTAARGSLFAELDAGPFSASLDSPHGGHRTPDVGHGTPGSGLRTSDEPLPLLFFDLETTGLSGGAGICAFLIGFGWFEAEGFRTRQYFLSGYGHEAAVLRMASARVADVTLVSFNGKTFDVPLIDGRYLFHRVPSPFDAVPHVDLLHPARRLWRHRPAGSPPIEGDRRDAFARYFRMTRAADLQSRRSGTTGGGYALSVSAASCALSALEEAVLGFRRTDDVPGGEIPGRYFQYVRTGDVRPLESVLEHNRLDLLSLGALSGVVARMVEEGASAARNAHECLALGHLFERSGSGARAVACYERAIEGHAAAGWRTDPIVEREALRRLALRHRRERHFNEAAAAWQRLLDLPSTGAGPDVEAVQALAIHHEHRSKNLEEAHTLVVRALERTRDRNLHEALRYRLARLERKLGLRP